MMEQGYESTPIDTRISFYMYIERSCPHCGELGGIGLDILDTGEWVTCMVCKKKFRFWNDVAPDFGEKLDDFLKAFDALYAQLQKADYPLYFLHTPLPTIWKNLDNSQHNT